MAGLRIDANALSYTAAMSACERMGQWQRSLSLLAELEHLKASPRCCGGSVDGIFRWHVDVGRRKDLVV